MLRTRSSVGPRSHSSSLDVAAVAPIASLRTPSPVLFSTLGQTEANRAHRENRQHVRGSLATVIFGSASGLRMKSPAGSTGFMLTIWAIRTLPRMSLGGWPPATEVFWKEDMVSLWCRRVSAKCDMGKVATGGNHSSGEIRRMMVMRNDFTTTSLCELHLSKANGCDQLVK